MLPSVRRPERGTGIAAICDEGRIFSVGNRESIDEIRRQHHRMQRPFVVVGPRPTDRSDRTWPARHVPLPRFGPVNFWHTLPAGPVTKRLHKLESGEAPSSAPATATTPHSVKRNILHP